MTTERISMMPDEFGHYSREQLQQSLSDLSGEGIQPPPTEVMVPHARRMLRTALAAIARAEEAEAKVPTVKPKSNVEVDRKRRVIIIINGVEFKPAQLARLLSEIE